MPEPTFDLQRILSETFVARLEFHHELPSTNDRALQLWREPALPLLVLAERQTAGRGRGSHRWWSGDGAILCTLLLDACAGLSKDRRPQISLTVGLAVCEMLAELLPGHQIGLKWPNDVHLESRKVCGILVENPPSGSDRVVIGIGVNVNNSFTAAPEELQGIGTSLCDVAGREFDKTDVLVSLLRHVERELRLLTSGSIDFPQRWQTLCVLQGRRVQLTTGQQSASGVCRGIDQQGAIVLETSAGPRAFFGGVLSCLD